MDHLALFKNVLSLEAKALDRALSRVNPTSIAACVNLFEFLTQTGGSLVVTGVGKSGLIGAKIASTFSSLGLPSFFLHPTEAMHGDLGRVSKSDVMLLLSKSGTTDEILELLPYLQLPKERLIALVGNVDSPIAQKSGIVLDCSVDKEACLNDLAPTTSTTLTLAMGDALAVLYESVKGVSKEQFALNHPAGLLGKSLSLTIDKLMVAPDQCAQVNQTAILQDALLAMTKFPVGLLAIVDGKKLLGILVEGDVRRALMKDAQALSKPVVQFMNAKPLSITPGILAYEALKVMENRERPVSVLPVVENGELKGVVRLHDLLQAGFSTTKTN
ncbi:MAG: KpsF/GutQ family sugar-phosphate isomerase [Bacteriovoracaceae bacterium]|nr:KpsF/GutQ family sugar-phosphate isomerase [Bacteriovoracaceae bacterium]